MKTQSSNFHSEQIRNNQTMIFIMVICYVLLTATSFTKIEARSYSTRSEDQTIKTLNPIESHLAPSQIHSLEIDKLRRFITQQHHEAMNQAVNVFSNFEEPEMLFEDIESITEFQEHYFNERNDRRFVTLQNKYLNDLYTQKNEEISAGLENERNLKELLVTENETELNIETWMVAKSEDYSHQTDDDFEKFLENMLAEKVQAVEREIEMNHIVNEFLALDSEDESWNMEDICNEEISPAPDNTNICDNRYLTGLLTAKNEAVSEAIEFERKCKEFLALTKEEPLQLEDWMVDEKCWCPRKSHKNYLYTEPYAMNNNK